MSNKPDISVLLLEVKRAIATAKMAEFERQAYRIGDIVSTGLLGPALAADVLLYGRRLICPPRTSQAHSCPAGRDAARFAAWSPKARSK